jgi:hypothetical protein
VTKPDEKYLIVNTIFLGKETATNATAIVITNTYITSCSAFAM